ncbi:MAG: hypothetical protein J0L73_19695 [Verrucomicrobia bacterium]|nr:hypothetical protein [Verrucomicrobiota bacterium]
MNPFVYCGLGIAVAALGAYTMAMQGATHYWGVRLMGGPTEDDLIRESVAQGASIANRGLQDAITPKSQTSRNIFFALGLLMMIVVGIVMYRWYWGVAGFFGTFMVTGLLKTFLPGPDSRFFRDILLSDMKQRQMSYTAKGDSLRAHACSDLIQKFGDISQPRHGLN